MFSPIYAQSQQQGKGVNWLEICRNPLVDALITEPCETLTTPDGYSLTPLGERVLKCITGGTLSVLTGSAGCGGNNGSSSSSSTSTQQSDQSGSSSSSSIITPQSTSNEDRGSSCVTITQDCPSSSSSRSSSSPSTLTTSNDTTAPSSNPTATSLQLKNETYQFVRQWGSNGTGDKQFINPQGIVVDSNGNVYVTDTSTNRIQKFDSDGNFVTSLLRSDPYHSGPGYDELRGSSYIDVDSNGNLYVTSWLVQKFDNNGNFIKEWGSYDTSNELEVNSPQGIAVDSSGSIYIANKGNNNVSKFDSSGIFIKSWGIKGTDDGQFNDPRGIAVDSSGDVYVVDSGNHRVQKFDSNGAFLTKWGSEGTGNGQFEEPPGIAVDSINNVYVSDTGNNRIQVFAPVTQNQINATSNINSNINENQTTLLPTGHAGISDQF